MNSVALFEKISPRNSPTNFPCNAPQSRLGDDVVPCCFDSLYFPGTTACVSNSVAEFEHLHLEASWTLSASKRNLENDNDVLILFKTVAGIGVSVQHSSVWCLSFCQSICLSASSGRSFIIGLNFPEGKTTLISSNEERQRGIGSSRDSKDKGKLKGNHKALLQPDTNKTERPRATRDRVYQDFFFGLYNNV